MELYRSGHNGAHSKCVCPLGHEGSNPSNSAQNPVHETVNRVLFILVLFYQISRKDIPTFLYFISFLREAV